MRAVPKTRFDAHVDWVRDGVLNLLDLLDSAYGTDVVFCAITEAQAVSALLYNDDAGEMSKEDAIERVVASTRNRPRKAAQRSGARR